MLLHPDARLVLRTLYRGGTLWIRDGRIQFSGGRRLTPEILAVLIRANLIVFGAPSGDWRAYELTERGEDEARKLVGEG